MSTTIQDKDKKRLSGFYVSFCNVLYSSPNEISWNHGYSDPGRCAIERMEQKSIAIMIDLQHKFLKLEGWFSILSYALCLLPNVGNWLKSTFFVGCDQNVKFFKKSMPRDTKAYASYLVNQASIFSGEG